MRAIQSFRQRLLNRIVLRPSRNRIDAPAARRVTFDWRGKSIEYFALDHGNVDSDESTLILKFPGTAGRAERSSVYPLNLLGETGRVLTWNPPGYGQSQGRASLAGIASAAQAFVDHVMEAELGRASRVWLIGNSLGCNVVLHLAAQRNPRHRIDAVVLRNPPPLIPVIKRIAARYPLGRFIDPVAESLIDSMNAEITADQVDLPAVFVQCELDALVPLTLQKKIIDSYTGPKQSVILKGLDHDGIPNDSQDRQILQALEWLTQQQPQMSVSP